MNRHQLLPSLSPLDRETLQLVVHDDALYRTYVDSLALIHDLICEFADTAEKPRLTSSEIEAQKKRLLENIYDRIPAALKKNIIDNFHLAEEICNTAMRSKSADARFEAELRATQFLNSLVKMYTTLRILKQYNEPTHP